MVCVYLGIAACRGLPHLGSTAKWQEHPRLVRRLAAHLPSSRWIRQLTIPPYAQVYGRVPERTLHRVASRRSGGATHGTESRRRLSQAP